MTEFDKLLIKIEENRHRKDLTPAEIFETGKKLEKLVATPKGRPKNGKYVAIELVEEYAQETERRLVEVAGE